MSSVSFSDKESKRFGMNIYRGAAEHIDAKAIKETILKNNVDILIIRIPTDHIAEQQNLAKIGFDYISADTLIYYKADLLKSKAADLRNADVVFTLATDQDATELNSLVEKIFVGYTNHYNTNPFLNKEHITEGYQEWVRDYISGGQVAGRMTWMVRRGGATIGFATCSYDEQTRSCEGVLYGVLPEHSGGGIYTDIIRFTKKYFKEQGYEAMRVSTQIQNVAVQKVWMREEFYIEKSLNTYHINSLLQYSLIASSENTFTISEQDIQQFAEVTGDFNPIHFDDEFAQSQKLKGRIAHGIIPNALLTKYYGMDYPGQGTLFLKYNYLFLRPLYVNEEYRITVTFPLVNKESGIHKSVARIIDRDDNVCLIAYNDLMKKG